MTELRDRARLDLALGRFRNAEAETAEVNRLSSSDSDLMLHAEQAARGRDLHRDNRPRDAAAVADDYLKRNEVWIGSGQFDGVPY